MVATIMPTRDILESTSPNPFSAAGPGLQPLSVPKELEVGGMDTENCTQVSQEL